MIIKILAFCLFANQALASKDPCPKNPCNHDRGDAYCPVPKVYKVERPCPKFDICCIRKYFYEHGHCKVPQSKTPYLKIDRAFAPLPSFNVTLMQEPVEFHGSNDANVTEFYINKETGRVLLSLRFGHMKIKAVNRVIRQVPRKEFVIFDESYNTTEHYDYVETTTQFQTKCLELKGSKTHADEPLPSKTDSSQCNNDDLNILQQNLPTMTIEIFVPRGYALSRYWIQRFICDYSIDPAEPILTTF